MTRGPAQRFPDAIARLAFNGISNGLTQDDQIAAFENAAPHFEPGERFVIELNCTAPM